MIPLNIYEKASKKKLLIILALMLIFAVGGALAAEKMSDNPAFCANCHNMQSYYDSWKDSKLLANAHAQAGINCHDCHTPSLTQQAEEGLKFITGNFETPLKKREFPQEMCLKCHKTAEVIPKTNFGEANPHDSHQGVQECNKCHNMHQESKVMCSQCHDFEWMSQLPPSFKKSVF